MLLPPGGGNPPPGVGDGGGEEAHILTRYLMIAAVLLWMVFLELAGGEGVVIPSETTCTRHPPAQQTIDAPHLTGLLVQKGIITRQEAAQLMQPQGLTSGGGGRGVPASVLTRP